MICGYTRVSVIVIPTADRLSRDTSDLRLIDRDTRRAGACLRSIAEPVVDTASIRRRVSVRPGTY
jgi:DNA invertase Pin-like site-specific DNA recombinase